MVRVKDVMSEKIASVCIDETVQRALEKIRSIGANKIVVYNIIKKGDFWVIPAWKLRLVDDPNITLLRACSEKKEIFEKVGAISSTDGIGKAFPDLYKVTGLVVADREKIVGFLSLADFSELDLERLKAIGEPSLDREEFEQRVRNKESLMDVSLHGDYSRIDLHNADLRSADLSESNLSKADLREADLSNANLSGADLTEAKLMRTKLRGANLTGAKLVSADLRYAELWSANLEKANLNKADLSQAVLFNANLKGAILDEANLRNAGMMSVRLENAKFRGAKTINTNLKYAKFNEESDFTGAEINWLTMQTLTERSLEAKWDTEVEKFIKEKQASET